MNSKYIRNSSYTYDLLLFFTALFITGPRMYLYSSNKENEIKMYETKQDDSLHKVPSNYKHQSCLLWLSVLCAMAVVITVSWTLLVSPDEMVKRTEVDPLTNIPHARKKIVFAQEGFRTRESDREGTRGVLVCYYTISDALKPRDIHPQLCTHINVGFAQVEDKQVKLDANMHRTLAEVVKLKSTNPKLKILLSIGGAGDQDGFSQMVVDHASRKTFIRSLKYILRNYTLDGIDLDWEFPAVHSSNYIMELKGKRERQHFSQLLREIRAEYIREKRDYLLTVAVAAPQSIVDAAYDVDQIDLYVDFVNIMTYDFHYFTKFTPFTGLNSPLYARPSEELFFATLNINYTVNMYISKGLSKNKIVVGIPTYGHTFTLMNPDNTDIGSPASGFGSLGSLGFINYPEICLFIKNATNKVVVKEETAARVPYLYGGKEWVSFDTPLSVTEKAKFIKENRLRGAMIFSLNADDYQGVCNEGVGSDIKFPLAHAAKKLLIGT